MCEHVYSKNAHVMSLSFERADRQGNNDCCEGCQKCSCIRCGDFDVEEVLVSETHCKGVTKKHFKVLEQNFLERDVLLYENKAVRTNCKNPLKFLSLFLTKSSFLI